MAKDTTDFNAPASAWLERFAPHFQPGMRVLELACGNGRNTRLLARLGCRVTAADISPMPVVPAGVEFVQCDLEHEPWPWPAATFDAVVGINYLWRARWKELAASLRTGGLFLYETFTQEQSLGAGKPKNPEHFLLIGELLGLVDANWRILAYEDGLTGKGQYLQRIAARKCLLKNALPPADVRVCASR